MLSIKRIVILSEGRRGDRSRRTCISGCPWKVITGCPRSSSAAAD